jgi:hypothetical protein
MPTMLRPNKKSEDLFQKIMGEPRNMSKKISIKQPRIETGVGNTNQQVNTNGAYQQPREYYEK